MTGTKTVFEAGLESPGTVLTRLMRSWAFFFGSCNAINPGQAYSARELAAILGTEWTPKRVAAKLNVMGRPEKRFGTRIFERPAPGSYALTQPMKAAILDPTN